MFPRAEVPFDLGTCKTARVLERKSVQWIAHNLCLAGMGVEGLAHPQSMAPVKGVRAQHGKFKRRIEIVTLDEKRCLHGCITSCNTCESGIEAPVQRQCSYGPVRN